MEALLIINAILVAVCSYFFKNLLTEFKELSKQVARLDNKVKHISYKLGSTHFQRSNN